MKRSGRSKREHFEDFFLSSALILSHLTTAVFFLAVAAGITLKLQIEACIMSILAPNITTR